MAEKRFKTTGPITPSDVNSVFMVPIQVQELRLLKLIMQGESCLLHGKRQSGKTTQLFFLCDYLEKHGYPVIRITLQDGMDFATPEIFWRTFLGLLRSMYPDKFILQSAKNVNAETEFYLAISKLQNAVLMIDDCDNILNAPTSVVASFCSVVRRLKHDYTTNIKSVVCVGVYQIMSLTQAQPTLSQIVVSPFNASLAIEAEPITKAQYLEHLCVPWQEAALVSVQEDVFTEIYELSNGHHGTLCFLNEILDENVSLFAQAGKGAQYTIHDWNYDKVYRNWYSRFRGSSSITTMMDRLQNPAHFSPKKANVIRQAKEFLFRNLLLEDEVHVPDIDDAMKYLLSEGIVNQTEVGLSIAYPLLRSALLATSMRAISAARPSIPVDRARERVDLPQLILKCLPLMSVGTIFHARATNASSHPSEYAFHAELLIVLNWILTGNNFNARVINEARHCEKLGRKRMDILICNSQNYVIEIGVNLIGGSLTSHLKRTLEYSAVNGTASLCLNFVTDAELLIKLPQTPPNDNAFLLHVFVDYERRVFTIFDSMMKQIEDITLSTQASKKSFRSSTATTTTSSLLEGPENWNPNEVAQWVSSLSPEIAQMNYAAQFIENGIDGEELLHLTLEDLHNLGVKKIGHVNKILRHIASLS